MARNPDWFLFNKIFESYDRLQFQISRHLAAPDLF